MGGTSGYSVAIVGAGPTGLVLANLLGKAGVRTILFEAHEATVSEPRAVSIDDESLRVMQAIGLVDAVLEQAVPGYGSEYRSPRGDVFLRVKPQAQPYGYPRRNAFRQPVLEAQLRERLSACPSVTTRFGCRVERFSDHGTGVMIHTQSVEVTADYLIACDGASSATRDALGAVLAGRSLDDRWLIIDLEESPSPSPETIVFCDPSRPGIALPGPRDTRRYEFKLLAGESDAEMLDPCRVAELMAAHGAEPGSRLVRKTVYHFHSRIADIWGRGRVWLAGDAAHLMPPFAGQGMNSGIRDAANLAWKLAEVVQGRIGPGLLDSYPRERRGHVAGMLRLARLMGAIFAPRTRAHGLAIRAGFRLLGLWPSARRYLAEMRYKPPPRFDDGFLLASQISRRGAVGRMLPQPMLASGRGGRLDELLGDGFALVGIGLAPATVERSSLGAGFDRLIARRVALALADVPSLAEHAGHLLLVRPDRYVMARFAPADTKMTAAALDDLWLRSWPAGSRNNGGIVISPVHTPWLDTVRPVS